MRRRQFITFLGGAAAAWPIAARAQQRTRPVIGYLGPATPDTWASRLRAFQDGLADAGYIEGRNVAIEYRWAGGQYDRLPSLAADLVRLQVSVIVADATPPALAAKAATTTIPIVFYSGGDPVAIGLVASLNRPGGNLTGVVGLNVGLEPKRIELLHEAIPAAGLIAGLVNPTNPNSDTELKGMQAAAEALGLKFHALYASSERDFDAVFTTIAQTGAGALAIASENLFNERSEQLASLALRHGVPAIYDYRDFAVAGGFMSYGGSYVTSYRLVGSYTGRILNGEKPANLPVPQQTRVELTINLKTAKALGITVPQLLLGRADEIIE
jgi:putative ABC transport system substrate-binding protein